MKQGKLIIKKIQPLYTRILTTADTYTEIEASASGILDPKKIGMIKPIQKILAVGTSCRAVAVGDLVALSLDAYGVRKQKKNSLRETIDVESYESILEYQVPMVEVNGSDNLFIDERDVTYVITDHEYVEEKAESKLILPKSNIII